MVVAQLCLAAGASGNTFEADPGSLGSIPDGTSATPGNFGAARDVTFTVPAATFASGSPTHVAVTFASDHTFAGDLDVVLVAPNDEQATIFSRTGAATAGAFGHNSNLGGPYTFSDLAPASPTWWAAAGGTPDARAIPGGSYRASTAGPGTGPNAALTTGFFNVPDMNGSWTLRVRDGTAQDTGSITAASLELVGTVPATPGFLGPIPDGPSGAPLNVLFSVNGLAPVAPSSISTSMTFSPNHTYVGDLEVKLIAPDNAEATIFGRTGDTVGGTNPGDSSDLAGPYSFFDNALGSWWTAAGSAAAGDAVPSGSYRASAAGGAGSTGANTLINPAFAGVADPNGVWTLRFVDRAGGDAGSVSAASLRILSGTDTTAPIAPSVGVTDPATPSNSSLPTVKGNTDSGTTVRLYPNGDCSGLPTATGTAAVFTGAVGIPMPIDSDGETTITATTYDAGGNVSLCSNAITYTRDTVAPGPLTLAPTDPASPANNNFPKIKGSGAEADSTVTIYNSHNCTGEVAAFGIAADFNGAGIEIEVPGDAFITLSLTATDEAGNASPCAGPITYTEDSTILAPTLSATDPASGSNGNSPKIQGSAETGSGVGLYTTSDCSGPPAATGTAAQLAGPGIAVSVPDDSTTAIRAVAQDLAGNVSTCSEPLSYTEVTTAPPSDTTSPDTTAETAKTNVKTKKKSIKVGFELTSSEQGSSFECSIDDAAFAACGSAPEFKLKKGKHTLEAVAIDAAGNRDPSPASVKVRVVKKKKR